jgi:hypothetical protein
MHVKTPDQDLLTVYDAYDLHHTAKLEEIQINENLNRLEAF